jgi:molybdate transport system ATP-binding protein
MGREAFVSPGTALRIRIEAQDVTLALQRPKDISALNVLPATVTSIRMGAGPGALVQLQAGNNLILSRITRRSADALRLAPGTAVFAILKAVSIPRSGIGDRRLADRSD